MTVRPGALLRVVVGTALLALVATGCAITRVSVSSTGTEGDKASDSPRAVTDDGRYVLFASEADNLVPGDSNGAFDVFRHDTETGATIRVDVTGTGAQLPLGSFGAAMTANGRYVAFETRSAALPADTNGVADAYVRDLVDNTTTLVSTPPAGGFLLNSQVGLLDISTDGRYISFLHGNTGENALYRHDRQTGTTTKLVGPAHFIEFQMSGDARHYAIDSRCDLVIPPPGCFPTPLIFDADGSAGGWPPLQFPACPFDEAPAVSPDGRYLAWYSAHVFGSPAGCQLPNGSYVVDRTTGVASPLNLPDNPNTRVVAVSRNARAVLYSGNGSIFPGGTAGRWHLYLRDQVNHTDTRPDISLSGQEADAKVVDGVLSDDGTYVAFSTEATNLIPDDHNGVSDVFVRKTGMPASP